MSVRDGAIRSLKDTPATVFRTYRDTGSAQVVEGSATEYFIGSIASDDVVYAAFATEIFPDQDYRRRYFVGRDGAYVPQSDTANLTGTYVATLETRTTTDVWYFDYQVTADIDLTVDFDAATIAGETSNTARFFDIATVANPWIDLKFEATAINGDGTFNAQITGINSTAFPTPTPFTTTEGMQGVLGGEASTHAAGWVDLRHTFGTSDTQYRERGAFVASN